MRKTLLFLISFICLPSTIFANEVSCRGGSFIEGEVQFAFIQPITNDNTFILSETIKNEDTQQSEFQVLGVINNGKIKNLAIYYLKYNVRSEIFSRGLEDMIISGNIEDNPYYLKCNIQ
ncbi:MAG: hypothetical protein DRQ88_01425 [Epsilonproteobacteria bacterium]|nr:MAG: hypothetical protein DRQ89_05495 [Campylobacterota bacterium]RLA67953.1 MAG: hypothetical protein DRQ88_01425 [Campylobacterota bacterium]